MPEMHGGIDVQVFRGGTSSCLDLQYEDPITPNSSSVNPCESKSLCYEQNISEVIPLDWAVPLYGYLMPILVIFTTTTNLFIVIVLSQRHLRTPTNLILLSMAISDLLTGWTSSPWFLYYYTLGGHVIERRVGISSFWCKAYGYLYGYLPSMFHTTTIWLTVFLAVQRYVYVCVPNSVHLYCTPRKTKLCIFGIFFFSFATSLHELLSKYSFQEFDPSKNRTVCKMCYADWVRNILGMSYYMHLHSWIRTSLHVVPCILLLIFTRKLAKTIKAAEVRKRSWATEGMYDRRGDRRESISPRCTVTTSGRSMYATNRMLAVICLVFFLLEIPAGLINVLLTVNDNFDLTDTFDEYGIFDFLNRFLIIRHLLIVLSSPIQFGIYCSMSEQFRLTARQLFTSRLLFVAQAQATFHGGKRYSLILVDVETFEAKRKQSAARRNLLARGRGSIFDRTTTPAVPNDRTGALLPLMHSKRKVGRQVSFPDEETRERDRTAALNRNHHSLRHTLRKSLITNFRKYSDRPVASPSMLETSTTVNDDSTSPNSHSRNH